MSDASSDNRPTDGDDLVVRARTDRAAFGLLFDRYYPRVLRYCRRRLFDLSVAEDATSEVFLNIAGHYFKFPGQTETDFRCWLFRIATNAVHAQLRQSLRRQELWEAAARSGRLDRDSTSHDPSSLESLHDWPAVYRAILDLNDREQSIVMLRFFADLSHEEIANIVGATPAAVRTSLSRTLAKLREQFAPSVATPPARKVSP